MKEPSSMYLERIKDIQHIQEIILNLELMYNQEANAVDNLVFLLQDFRLEPELINLFWWLDYASAQGYTKAEHYYPELVLGIAEANRFFQDRLAELS